MIYYWIKSLIRIISKIIFNRYFLIFLSVLILSIFIWFAGPLFGFADSKPLETEQSRLILIAVLFFIYSLYVLVIFWKKKEWGSYLITKIFDVKNSISSRQKPHESIEEAIELKNIFSDAERKLKTLHTRKKTYKILDQNFIYDLPWYMVIGASGSGKTTALSNAGLNFTFSDAQVENFTNTKNCVFGFTDQAILIDTAGRYTIHDHNKNLDKLEWERFIRLLKKYRPLQPINGVILTISASDLINLSSEEFNNHLLSLKSRLSEVKKLFAIDVPVYLWITKIDLLAGFEEFFAIYNQEKRNQVLGFTFPYLKNNIKCKATKLDFIQEFSALENSIYNLENEHLANEDDLFRRNFIYAFPQQFSSLKSRIEIAFDFLFSENSSTNHVLLRGIYFCSGTQTGNTIDQVLNTMGHSFRTAGKVFPKHTTNTKKSYFIHELFLKLIFPESFLAGRDSALERRSKLVTCLGYLLSLTLLIFFSTAWIISYQNNIKYLEQVDKNSEYVSNTLASYNNNKNTDIVDIMEVLEQLTAVGNTPDFTIDGAPLTYRYGLYQGDGISSSITYSYEKILNQELYSLIAKRLEFLLRNPPVDSLEYLYEALKAYLMLYQEENYSKEFLIEWVKMDFQRFLLPDSDSKVLDSIDHHLRSVFKDNKINPPNFPLDKELVRITRDKLSTLSVPQRAYSRLMGRLSNHNLNDFNLLDIAGPQATNIFFRESGLPLNGGIPGIFTYQGYWDFFDKSLAGIVAEVSVDEGWVLGLPSQSIKTQFNEAAQGKLIKAVRLIYLREYQRIWSEYLKDIKIIPSESLGSTLQRLSIISSPDSPLPLFLRAVVRETTLLRQKSSTEVTVMDRVKRNITQTKNDLDRVIGPMEIFRNKNDGADELIVDHYFEPLRRAVGSPDAKNNESLPIANIMKILDEYYGVLIATDSAIRTGSAVPPPDAAIRLKSEASRLPSPLGEMIATIANESTKQTSRLVYTQMGANLNATVGDFCRKAIDGRYPLNSNSNEDVTLQDFSRLFGPQGLMSDFFRKNLVNVVDTTTWTLKKNIDGSLTGRSRSLQSFEKSQVIQNVFFSDGESLPKIRIEMKVVEMDPSIYNMSLDIDGTIIRYSHGPQLAHAVVWPGPRGTQQVSLQISDQHGEQSAISTEGSWALHRFFDKLIIASSLNQEHFTATAEISGKKIKFEVMTSSIQNPFRLSQLNTFSCPSNL